MKTVDLIKRMRDGEVPQGIPFLYGWDWEIQGEPCTRAVNTLIQSGMAEVVSHPDCPSIKLKND